MNLYLKETLKALLVIIIMLLISSLIINILYYFDILNNDFLKFIKLIFSLISFFTGGYIMGLNTPKKGYIYGLRLSFLIVLIQFILGIIFHNFNLTRIIYYIITITMITFGSMIGIQKK